MLFSHLKHFYRWINVSIRLHGSCARFSKGLCGVWNGNRADDLFKNSPYENGAKYKDFDRYSFDPPAAPFRPCDNIDPDRKAEVLATCSRITGKSFISYLQEL